MRDATLQHHAVYLYRILVEEGMELLQLLRQRDGVHRSQLPVNLEDQVDILATAFAQRRNIVDSLADQPFQRHAFEAVWQRVSLYRSEAIRHRLLRSVIQPLGLRTPIVGERQFRLGLRPH